MPGHDAEGMGPETMGWTPATLLKQGRTGGCQSWVAQKVPTHSPTPQSVRRAAACGDSLLCSLRLRPATSAPLHTASALGNPMQALQQLSPPPLGLESTLLSSVASNITHAWRHALELILNPPSSGGVQLATWQLEVAGSSLQQQHARMAVLMHQEHGFNCAPHALRSVTAERLDRVVI